jgi:hypothetical protein
MNSVGNICTPAQWRCDFCDETGFKTFIAASAHERMCKMNPNAVGGIAGAASTAAGATMMAHGHVRTTSAAKSSSRPLQGATKEMEMKAASTPAVNPAGGSGSLKLKFGRPDPASESLPPRNFLRRVRRWHENLPK